MFRNSYPSDNHGWSELLPARKSHEPLAGTYYFPWVVVGVGVTGLAAARRLAQLHPDDEIMLIDARLVAQGASGRNSGYCVAHTHFPGGYQAELLAQYQRIDRINQAGLALLRQQVKEHSIQCQWDDSGYYHCAADNHALIEYPKFADYLNRMDISFTPLDHEELQQEFGTSLYKAGMHVEGNVLVQPAMLVRALADSQPPNVRVVEQNPVLKIDRNSPAVLHLANAEIKAEKLLLATNYEIAKLGVLRHRMIGTTLSGSFTRQLSNQEMSSLGTLRQWGILSLHGGGATIRLTSDRRICIRNTAEYHGAKLFTNQRLEARKKIHRQAFEKRFPQLAHVPFEYSWSGVEGVSANNTNFFEHSHHNIYFAGGYNGSGVSRGTAHGHALAEYASGGQSTLITDCLESPKAKWLPPAPLLNIGAYFTTRSRFRGVGLDR